ncbi:uncharacterized protein KIAA1143 homolog [Homalodisca vitripennis]|uniref:uncharacterized protein KIAA1143 homolog n=1 Tax=Homalodisca vitripennis TaxID=197043 RepID=UPI001EEAA01B|nr:uncharacterized protein KIAA1143 homolog [Homalodisca vitripennis]
MSKRRNVAYIKPQEPEFLARLKREAGFIEGPTVDTKRETLPELSDDEDENRTDDSPVVVVLKPGDLTQEEAEEIKKKQESGTLLLFSLNLMTYIVLEGLSTVRFLFFAWI